jgi:hypothetical protein
MECYFWKAKISNFQLDNIANELLPLDSNVRAKLTLMLKIKTFSKSFLSHIEKIK